MNKKRMLWVICNKITAKNDVKDEKKKEEEVDTMNKVERNVKTNANKRFTFITKGLLTLSHLRRYVLFGNGVAIDVMTIL